MHAVETPEILKAGARILVISNDPPLGTVLAASLAPLGIAVRCASSEAEAMQLLPDGNFDLLVGQFGDGKLRIYRNLGDNKNPKFGAYAYFKAGSADGKVPAG